MPPAAEALRWLIVVLLTIDLVIASFTDIRRRKIPNWTVIAAAALFVPWAFVGPNVAVFSALAAATLVFLLSFALFAFGIMGAGDSKMLTVLSLFAGLAHVAEFLFLVAMAGGAMAASMFITQPTKALVLLQLRGKGNSGPGIPYGVAISAGGLWIVWWMLLGPVWGRDPLAIF